ncbi:ribonuclease H-like domain-containing protein [Tanacetum coccineum]
MQTKTSTYDDGWIHSTTLIPGPVTTEEKVQKKNDVKERSMLLMALPNEHLMTFNQYKDAKTLFACFKTRLVSLDSIFNRLQKIVSQLAILGENISQEDLNLKFLRSLPSEWNTHVVVWRNKPDLDTMSFDDLYNNFKIVEQEVKRTASSSSSSQNMAFVSSPSSTNEVNTAYGVSTANTQVSPASTQVSTASTQVSTANLSDATVYAFLANQPNGSQLVHEDLEQIHEDNLEEMDLKWQLALLSMRTRRWDTLQGNAEDLGTKIAGTGIKTALEGLYMANDEVPSNMALMAFLDSKGVGFVSYNAVPPPHTGLFSPPNLDLSYSGLEEFQQPEFKVVNAVRANQVNAVKASDVGVWRLPNLITLDFDGRILLPLGEEPKEGKLLVKELFMKNGMLVIMKPQSVMLVKKDDEGVCKESGIDDQERPKNNTQDVNTAGPTRIEAIRLFLAYDSFMGFMVYQIDMKSAFLYERIREEVYVCQPPGFEDPNYPDKVLTGSELELLWFASSSL